MIEIEGEGGQLHRWNWSKLLVSSVRFSINIYMCLCVDVVYGRRKKEKKKRKERKEKKKKERKEKKKKKKKKRKKRKRKIRKLILV